MFSENGELVNGLYLVGKLKVLRDHVATKSVDFVYLYPL